MRHDIVEREVHLHAVFQRRPVQGSTAAAPPRRARPGEVLGAVGQSAVQGAGGKMRGTPPRLRFRIGGGFLPAVPVTPARARCARMRRREGSGNYQGAAEYEHAGVF